MADLVLHHLEQSRSQRILWLLEELGVDYEMKRYPRDRGARAPQTLRDVHPLGKSPVITHGDRVIAESGAIVEYLLDEVGEGRLRPAAGTEDHRRYRFFLHFAEASLMPALLVKLITGRVRSSVPILGKIIAGKVDASYTDAEIVNNFSFVDRELKGREWLAGELSGADMMMSYPATVALRRAELPPLPDLTAYLARIEARPAYQRALELGGPVLFG
ncbi:MAG: glutathione S-transferase [Polyangiaceae bacterium]